MRRARGQLLERGNDIPLAVVEAFWDAYGVVADSIRIEVEGSHPNREIRALLAAAFAAMPTPSQPAAPPAGATPPRG